MKHLLIFSIIMLTVSAAIAEPFTVQFTASACETNASAVTTYTPDNDVTPLYGFVEAIIIDQTGTGTGTVSVATLAGKGTGPSRSVLSIATISADGVYPVRDLVATQAGMDIAATPCKIPLVGDKLRLQLFNWGAESNTCKIWAVITPEQ